jgi:hypothetical protein
MKRLLNSLSLAAKHLSVIDKVFRDNYPPYTLMSNKLHNLPLHDELRKEIYAGGKKRGVYGYARQMILGDLLQYIFTGRGYYFAVRGSQQKEAFISMILYICNLLILMEDISVDVKLRNVMLDSLRRKIGSHFFEDTEQEDYYDDLRAYKGLIIPSNKEADKYDNILDSMLPKRVGAVPELLVYAYLIRKNYGYVVPLLHAQRLLGNQTPDKQGWIVPPDFLLLRSKGEIFGIEVGRGKEQQIGSFSTVTSIPVFTTGVGSYDQPQPYRCGKCLRWITYCDEVIRLCSNNKEPNSEYVDCRQCSLYKNLGEALKKCPYVVYHGRAKNYYGKTQLLRYHYNCVKNDPDVASVIKRAKTPKLIAPIPWLSGLKYLSKDV